MTSTYLSDLFEQYGLFSLVVSTICTILLSIAFTHYIHNDFLKHKHKSCIGDRSQLHSSITSCCLLFFILYSLQTCILSLYWTVFAKPNHSFHAPWCLASFNQYWFFLFGKIAMYWFWFIRIHQIFKNSAFAVSPRKLKILAFVFTLPICFLAFVMGYAGGRESMGYVLNPHNDWSFINSFSDCHTFSDTFETPTIHAMKIAAIALYSVSEIIYTVVVIRLFISNILRLSEYCCGHSSQSFSSSTTANKHIDEQKFFLELSIKTSFLMILATCTNYITFIKFAMKLPSFVVLFDVLTNFMSVYLSFSFASKYYNMLFSTWHNQCYSVCAKLCYLCCAPKELKGSDESMISRDMNQNMREMKIKKMTLPSVHKAMDTVASDTNTVIAISA